MSATPSDRTLIPEGDLLYFEVIKRAFKKAWMQPSYDEVGGSIAKIEVKFQLDGSISGVKMTQKSGHANMDYSRASSCQFASACGGAASGIS